MSATLTSSALPPSYSDPIHPPSNPTTTSFDIDTLSPEPDLSSPLPAYTPGPSRRHTTSHSRHTPTAAQPKEFYYELKKRGRPFACLTLMAEGGSAFSKHMPTFLEGEKVKGRVELRLERPESGLEVVVQIQGQVITGANPGEQLTFIDISHTLWSPAMGDPRGTIINAEGNSNSGAIGEDASPSTPAPSAPSTSSTSTSNTPSSPSAHTSVQAAPVGPPPKFTGKLQGTYTWPFALDLPKEIIVPSGPRGEVGVFTPPQTFNERHARASVVYEVILRVGRGKLLRGDHRIPAQFGYIPVVRPPAFSELRRMAYAEGSKLLGPTVDVEGWYAPEGVRVKGTFLHNRSVDIGCTLHLAKPLSYTRGAVIPMCMELTGEDVQALDLLAAPKAIVVRLRRRVKHHVNPEKKLESFAWRDAIEHSQLAVWWPSSEGTEDAGNLNGGTQRRFVNGELHLRNDVKPSSAMAYFRIEYSVVLFPFDTVGFEQESSGDLLEVPVSVVTAYAPGPRPRMSTPPGYDSDAQNVPAPRAFSSMSAFM